MGAAAKYPATASNCSPFKGTVRKIIRTGGKKTAAKGAAAKKAAEKKPAARKKAEKPEAGSDTQA